LQSGATVVGRAGVQFAGAEALAIVRDHQMQCVTLQRQDDIHMPGLGMFARVEQSFLQDSDKREPCVGWQLGDWLACLELELSGWTTSPQMGIYLSADPRNEKGVLLHMRRSHVGNEFTYLVGGLLRPLFQVG
jgi:hypothetical protein